MTDAREPDTPAEWALWRYDRITYLERRIAQLSWAIQRARSNGDADKVHRLETARVEARAEADELSGDNEEVPY